jgi:hypothetical protein
MATALLNGPWRSSLGSRRELLKGIETAHLEHAAALLGSDPTTRPTAPPDQPVEPIQPRRAFPTYEVGAARLRAAEEQQAAAHRRSALSTMGYGCLLWGSMSIAATTFAAALRATRPVPVRKPREHRPMPELADVDAMQQLVRQLHAIIYGYQLAAGQLLDRQQRTSALQRLRAHRIELDALTRQLLSRSAEVPVAEPAYIPDPQPTTPARAARLILNMEVALAPFCGMWLAAAANPVDQRRAFATLAATVTAGRSWGAPVLAWPGWSS